jgi:hypothetical protein
MVVTPGPPVGSSAVRAGALAADEDHLGRVDPVHYGSGWIADAQGRITVPALIPGATYRITAGSDRREFTVGPGETVELGDIPAQGPAG